MAGATSSVSCSLCQAGTYWTGSGSLANFSGAGVRLTGVAKKHTQACGTGLWRNISPCLFAPWLLPVRVSIGLVHAACVETPCLQGPLLQAAAASASPGPTRQAQVWCGLPHGSLQPRFRTAPIDCRLRGGACVRVVCAETPCSQEALLQAYAASVRPGHTQAAQVGCGWLVGQISFG